MKILDLEWHALNLISTSSVSCFVGYIKALQLSLFLFLCYNYNIKQNIYTYVW